LVFIQKSNQTEIFLKKNRNRVKPTGFGSVFWAKTGSNRFGLVFSILARFFSVWLGFGSVFSVSVQFGFLLLKLKPNRTGRFFQNFNWFNRFFFGSVFSVIFSGFLCLIGFSDFLLIPIGNCNMEDE
jgi:hypothetical protein